MSKPEWGIKRICPSCGIKYYDFDKTPINCPKCNFEFDPDLLLKSRKGRGISNKVEENEKSNEIIEQNVVAEEEKEVSQIDINENILEIDDNEEVEGDINSEINENISDTIENEIDEDDEVPFIEEELDEDEISIEINEDEEKN